MRPGSAPIPTGARRRHAYDVGQSDIARLGFTRLGKEWILPVTVNKVTKQAAIIADLEPAAAQALCADYQARKLFCQVKKPQEIVAPFGVLLALTVRLALAGAAVRAIPPP